LHSFQNIHGSPYSVNPFGWIALAVYTLLRLWLIADVELGKDEAVYWYWGQHLDASYALLPFAILKVAHAIGPQQEWFLRLPSILLGTVSTLLLFRLCRIQDLDERRSLWAAAAFALSHWIWHTSSYLHPDGFIVPCWLSALYLARRAERTNALSSYALMGVAGGCAVLCKYSGAFLVGGLGLAILLDGSRQNCWHRLAAFLLPAIIVASPLIHAQLSTGFYLPQTLSTLSRIEDLSNPLARLLFFVANPLFFVSPLLLYLLYRGFGHALKERDLQTLLPALCTIGAFLFFALARGQIKGNWILPGFLSLWPLAFVLNIKRWLLIAVVIFGMLQSAAIGVGLKYPGLYGSLGAHTALNKSYVGLVSKQDKDREPSYSWSERLCEYSGWQRFGIDFETMLHQQKIQPRVALVSTQYSISFTMAYYGRTHRAYYTTDDPRFRDLTDFAANAGTTYPEQVLFAIRKEGDIPNKPNIPKSLTAIYARREQIAEIKRSPNGCVSIPYQVYSLQQKNKLAED